LRVILLGFLQPGEGPISRRNRILSEIWGICGWNVVEAFFENADGSRVALLANTPTPETKLVLRVERRWARRCGNCGALCPSKHGTGKTRRWGDLPWGQHHVEIEATPERTKCGRCGARAMEMLGWADPHQRETRRFQQQLALQAASMPTLHVAVLYGLSWSTVHRAERRALERWAAQRPEPPLRQVGVDEKYLGRRHMREYRFHTIVSNLETGEPIWIGPGRDQAALTAWLTSLRPEQKAAIELFVADMHRPFWNAIRSDPVFEHTPIAHDAFHVMKRANEAISEIRKDAFFRAGPALRAVGRGTRWLVLRPWEKCSPADRAQLARIFAGNKQLARAYQIGEELRETLRAPGRDAMHVGLERILRRTQLKRNKHLRRLHDSLLEHREGILALGEHRPAAGRIEALNGNWETLVRRGRGYRNYAHLLLKLRFMTANPIRTEEGTNRFLALGLQPVASRRRAS
jgi:transposase